MPLGMKPGLTDSDPQFFLGLNQTRIVQESGRETQSLGGELVQHCGLPSEWGSLKDCGQSIVPAIREHS